MEYMVVKLSGNFLKRVVKIGRKVAVFINGERNGYVDEVLQLEEGSVEISADISGAQTSIVELTGTTASKPMSVYVMVV